MTRPAPEAPAVVAGATGHLGGALLERLLAEGRLVGCIVRAGHVQLGAEESALEVVGGDVRALSGSTKPSSVTGARTSSACGR